MASDPSLSRQRNAKKVQWAANHPKCPGERCEAEPATWRPIVNRQRCAGKGDCVEVCPYGVFTVGTIDKDEARALPLFARLKVRLHGNKTVFIAASFTGDVFSANN